MNESTSVELPPSVADYVRGFSDIRSGMQDDDIQILRALHGFSSRGATAAEVAAASSAISGWQRVNIRFGSVGRMLCEVLDIHPSVRRNGTFRWWTVLATGRWSERGFVWTMRPEVAEALEHLTWATSARDPLTEEIPTAGRFVEGSTVRVLVNAYERDPRARIACLNHHGTRCVVCGLDFGERYGALAVGFIHVHHLTPLADIGAEYEVDPVKDLRPVCPNCHAVIHLGRGCRGIQEVQSMLATAGARAQA